MRRRSCRKFSPEFKTKVALEALQERETLESLCKKYDLHPNQISMCKKQFKEEGNKVFETGSHSVAMKEKGRVDIGTLPAIRSRPNGVKKTTTMKSVWNILPQGTQVVCPADQ